MIRRVIVLLLCALCVAGVLRSETLDREYEIKAGFLHQFLLFADWPEAVFNDSIDTVNIGVLGDNPFGDMFENLKKKPIRGKRLEVLFFGNSAEVEKLKVCHVLFISASVQDDDEVRQSIELMKGFPVLTVSEEKIKKGTALLGMIHFVLRKNKVRFEINNDAAIHAGIKLRSQLLRVAVKIIGEENDGGS